jgi:putative heme-binding domain-containing protein
LAHGQPSQEGQHLLKALQPDLPLTVQIAAARGLADLDDPAVAALALEAWTTYSIPARREIIPALVRSPKLVPALLDAVLTGQLNPREIDMATQQALLNAQDPEVQRKAKSALANAGSGDRQRVVQEYSGAAELAGDSARGKKLFVEHCSNCHQLQGQGHRVGPDLSGISSRSRAALVNDILDPSREVAPDFVTYMVRTEQGQVLAGLLIAESATSVFIRRPAGIDDVVSRSDVQELRATRNSLMPDGFERSLTPGDLADLLTFLSRPALAGRDE